jgi:hypothetical protein
MLKYHKNLTLEKWGAFTIAQRVIMVANELNRAKNWLNKKDHNEALSCYERALELLCLTSNTLTNKTNMLREISRFKEMLSGQYRYLTENSVLEVNPSLFANVLVSLNKDAYNLLNGKEEKENG